jgi:hypothetical protein
VYITRFAAVACATGARPAPVKAFTENSPIILPHVAELNLFDDCTLLKYVLVAYHISSFLGSFKSICSAIARTESIMLTVFS